MCPSIDEWIRKKWCKYTVEYDSVIKKKKNEILPSATWMDPEGIVLSEISQTEKDKCYVISLISRI